MKENTIQFRKSVSESRWIMPTRDLEEIRNYGWILVGVGSFITLFMFGWISGPLFAGVQLLQQGLWFGWLLIGFSSFGMAGLFFALRFLILGFKIVRNTTCCEIAIIGNKLFSIEKLGLFDWRRKISLDKIEELVVEDAKEIRSERSSQQATFLPNNISALFALTNKSSDKRFMALVGYPEEVTLQLANQLSAEIGKSLSVKESPAAMKSSKSLQKNIPVSLAVNETHIPKKPDDCSIVVHESDNGAIAYEIPPAGVTKGSKGLFGFSILWLVFCAIIFGSAFFAGEGDGDAGFFLMFGLMGVLFVGVGIALLLTAINAGKRSVMIGVLKDQFFIERKSIFGTKWLEFDRNDVVQVQMGDSQYEVNDVPIKELKVITRDGKSSGLLQQLSNEELEWLAHSLNYDLGIDPVSSNSTSWRDEIQDLNPKELEYPQSSRIQMTEDTKRITISVPNQKKSFLASLVMGLIFMGVGLAVAIADFQAGFGAWVFGSLFLLIGFAAVGAFLFVGLRKFEIRVDSKNLEVSRQNFYGSRLFQWRREDIESIELFDSGMKVNQKTIYQLKVKGKPESLALMAYSTTREIALTAAILHRELQLESEAPKVEW